MQNPETVAGGLGASRIPTTNVGPVRAERVSPAGFMALGSRLMRPVAWAGSRCSASSGQSEEDGERLARGAPRGRDARASASAGARGRLGSRPRDLRSQRSWSWRIQVWRLSSVRRTTLRSIRTRSLVEPQSGRRLSPVRLGAGASPSPFLRRRSSDQRHRGLVRSVRSTARRSRPHRSTGGRRRLSHSGRRRSDRSQSRRLPIGKPDRSIGKWRRAADQDHLVPQGMTALTDMCKNVCVPPASLR
jgi:hypothetical protein